MKEPIYERGFHDIYLSFKGRRILFCPFEVNEDRVSSMITNDLVDYVYVPYNDPLFGTLAYLSIIKNKTFDGMDRKFLAIGFKDQTSANFCRLHYPYSYPMTYQYAFANSVIGITDTCDKICVGESALDHASVNSILNNQAVDIGDIAIKNPNSDSRVCNACPQNKPKLPPRPEKFIPPTAERPLHPFTMPEIDGTISIPNEVPSDEPSTPEIIEEETE